MNRPALNSANTWKAVAALGLLVFLIFGKMLFAPGSLVLGNKTTDMFLQFYSWREFGFGQLAQGNLPLWNPHIYGGAPYFGGTQAALLYPTNWLLLFLPLPLAINWSIALNVWLIGIFMYLWAGFRGLRPLACFMAGALLMFCGPHFLHIYAGHPVHMAAMAWVPLIFLCLDAVLALPDKHIRAQLKWWLLGMFAVAMQIFAGHPQYLFYTAITAGFYILFFAVARWRAGAPLAKSLTVPGLSMFAIFAGGSALAAVQLLTAFQANAETIRSTKVPFEFAAMFGFPPENLLTLLNPYFFGNMFGQPYWGRCYLWEMSLFIGVIGLAFAVYAFLGTEAGKKQKTTASPFPDRGILLAMVVVTFVFALGVHTPLFQLLYDWVPGFSKFRAISKFIFPTALFLLLLSAIGFDRLLSQGKATARFIKGTGAAGLLLLLFSAWLYISTASDFQQWLRLIEGTKESYLPTAAFNSLTFAEGARLFAAKSLFIPGALLLLTAGLLHIVPKWHHALHLLALVAVLESFFFARHTLDTFDTRTVVPPGVKEVLDKNPGDYRILNLFSPNSALSIGAQDLWGFDPGAVRRYAEFIGWTQGVPPDQVTQYVNFQKLDPLYAMLRFRYAFVPGEKGGGIVEAKEKPMERVQLISRYRVLIGRDAIFNTLRIIDLRKEAVLETAPSIEPTPSDSPGTVKVTASSTDWLEIEADLSSPALLLNTDIYTPSWRAVALPGSSQQDYHLQPANYILRTIPLQEGHHRLRIEYGPKVFSTGAYVSIVSLALLAGAFTVFQKLIRKP